MHSVVQSAKPGHAKRRHVTLHARSMHARWTPLPDSSVSTSRPATVEHTHSRGSHHLWWWSFHTALPAVSGSLSLWERVRVRVSGRRRCAPLTPALSPREREEIPFLSAPPSRGLPAATRSAGGVSLVSNCLPQQCKGCVIFRHLDFPSLEPDRRRRFTKMAYAH